MRNSFEIDYNRRLFLTEKKSDFKIIKSNNLISIAFEKQPKLIDIARKVSCIEKMGLSNVIKIYLLPEWSYLDEWIPDNGNYFLN